MSRLNHSLGFAPLSANVLTKPTLFCVCRKKTLQPLPAHPSILPRALYEHALVTFAHPQVAWDNNSTLTNQLNTQAVQRSHLQAAHTALQTTAQNLANKVQALGPLPAEKAALAAELVTANAKIQELTAQCAPPICSVCMTTDGNFGFLHSSEMHAGYCLPCSQEIFNTGAGLCPVCRVQIEAVIKVFNQ